MARFYWLIAEYDPVEKIAFGYANLNDDVNAEWGYINMAELIEVGAWPEKRFKLKAFRSLD